MWRLLPWFASCYSESQQINVCASENRLWRTAKYSVTENNENTAWYFSVIPQTHFSIKFIILIDRRNKIQLIISQQPPPSFSLTLLKMTTWCNITHSSLKEAKHPLCTNWKTRSIWHYIIVRHCRQYLGLQFKMNVKYWNGLAKKKHNRKIGFYFFFLKNVSRNPTYFS